MGSQSPSPVLPIAARGVAGTAHAQHQRSPRVRATRRCVRTALTTRRELRQRTESSPAIQLSSSCEVISTCSLRPVSGSVLTDTAVRVDVWKGVTAAVDEEAGFMVFPSRSSQ